MDSLVTNLGSLVAAVLSAGQKIGVFLLPLGIVVLILANFFGGERALRGVAVGIASLIGFVLILENATGLSNWATGLIGGPH